MSPGWAHEKKRPVSGLGRGEHLLGPGSSTGVFWSPARGTGLHFGALAAAATNSARISHTQCHSAWVLLLKNTPRCGAHVVNNSSQRSGGIQASISPLVGLFSSNSAKYIYFYFALRHRLSSRQAFVDLHEESSRARCLIVCLERLVFITRTSGTGCLRAATATSCKSSMFNVWHAENYGSEEEYDLDPTFLGGMWTLVYEVLALNTCASRSTLSTNGAPTTLLFCLKNSCHSNSKYDIIPESWNSSTPLSMNNGKSVSSGPCRIAESVIH